MKVIQVESCDKCPYSLGEASTDINTGDDIVRYLCSYGQPRRFARHIKTGRKDEAIEIPNWCPLDEEV